MALGVGALIPRAGLGLYAALETTGDRGWWAMLLLSIGCWAIVVTYLDMPRLRVIVIFITVLLWAALTERFIRSNLWGASLQGAVVICFGLSSALRMARIKHGDHKT